MKDKILFISTEFPPGPGGIGNHAWNLAKQLNIHIPTHILTVSDYANEKECLSFDKKEKLYIYRFKRYTIPLWTYFVRIIDIIRHCKTNYYSHYIFSGKFSLWMSNIIKLLFKKDTKLIGILHGSELLQSKRVFQSILINSLN